MRRSMRLACRITAAPLPLATATPTLGAGRRLLSSHVMRSARSRVVMPRVSSLALGGLLAATAFTMGVAHAAGEEKKPTTAITVVAPTPTAVHRGPSVRDRVTTHPKWGPGVVVLDSRAMEVLLSKLRDKTTPPKEFSYYTDRLLRLLVEEALALLPSVKPIPIETFTGHYEGLSLPRVDNIVGVSIIRSGDILLKALHEAVPELAVGFILIQRDESHALKRPIHFYSKFPRDVAKDKQILLVDPMLATGGSSLCAINELLKAGVKEENIVFLNVISCPEGIAALRAAYPRVLLVTAAVDPSMNDNKYITPGLGDFGDRYYNTMH